MHLRFQHAYNTGGIPSLWTLFCTSEAIYTNYIRTTHLNYENITQCALWAIDTNNAKVIRWLFNSKLLLNINRYFDIALEKGRLEILQTLNTIQPLDMDICLIGAVCFQHIQIIKWVQVRCNIADSDLKIKCEEIAKNNGNYRTNKFLLKLCPDDKC